ncbi:unnamed protein product [Victoria cruziana]
MLDAKTPGVLLHHLSNTSVNASEMQGLVIETMEGCLNQWNNTGVPFRIRRHKYQTSDMRNRRDNLLRSRAFCGLPRNMEGRLTLTLAASEEIQGHGLCEHVAVVQWVLLVVRAQWSCHKGPIGLTTN